MTPALTKAETVKLALEIAAKVCGQNNCNCPGSAMLKAAVALAVKGTS